MYKILSKILLSRLTPYTEEIIGDHQWGFWRTRSTTDHIFCFCHFKKKWEYSEAVHQVFIDFKKAYDSIKREVLYKISLSLAPHEAGKANKNVSDWNVAESR